MRCASGALAAFLVSLHTRTRARAVDQNDRVAMELSPGGEAYRTQPIMRSESLQDVPPESLTKVSDQAAPALSEEMVIESARIALATLNSSEGATMLEQGSGMIPGLSAESAMFKATDLLFGVTGIVLEDYPYACLCDATGSCQGDPMETSCKGRPGDNAAVRRAGGVRAALVALGGFVAAATALS
ncbi:unnamed protein product [Prorocentrum cordatum]|uniref:Uncharacterized protein n=1 Tax=Prorocentrum cordatum TaxID=2364126 RepID=A0ABN9T217_9DINO|nr:unnamed protein product [Polarella glacialis]